MAVTHVKAKDPKEKEKEKEKEREREKQLERERAAALAAKQQLAAQAGIKCAHPFLPSKLQGILENLYTDSQLSILNS